MDDEIVNRVIEQALEFWIKPEVERRAAEGTLSHDFALRGAQVIFDLDAEAPEVRLNNEVEAVAMARAARDIKKDAPVTEEDISEISDMLLTEADPNAGHLTMIQYRGGWLLAFDFRHNATRIADHVDAASEFLDAARWALENNKPRPFVDSLLGATELAAKGFLIAAPDKTLLTTRKHGYIQSRFNQEGRLKNVDSRFVDLLNRLWNLRRPARYVSRELDLDPGEMKVMLATGEEMLEVLRATSPKRFSVDDES